jgi:hypothetical protein
VQPPRGGPAITRVSVETTAPAHADAVVHASAVTLLWIRQGSLTYDDAHAQGLIDITGAPRHVDAAAAMFGLSREAPSAP